MIKSDWNPFNIINQYLFTVNLISLTGYCHYYGFANLLCFLLLKWMKMKIKIKMNTYNIFLYVE